jgi:predicted site-specific integrase-resolvase
MSAAEVAEATGYTISTVCRWARLGYIDAGKLPGIRGAWLIEPHSIATIRPKNGRSRPQA